MFKPNLPQNMSYKDVSIGLNVLLVHTQRFRPTIFYLCTVKVAQNHGWPFETGKNNELILYFANVLIQAGHISWSRLWHVYHISTSEMKGKYVFLQKHDKASQITLKWGRVNIKCELYYIYNVFGDNETMLSLKESF